MEISSARPEGALAQSTMIAREFFVPVEGRRVPAVVWTPEAPLSGRPLVLIGHGGSQHKTHAGVVELAARFVDACGFAAAAIDGPVHGARRSEPLSGLPMQAEFLALWKRDGRIDDMVADWRGVIDALGAVDGIDVSSLGWYGVSMGTAYGLPLIAAEPRIRAAVLGMWGLDFVNSERLGTAARAVRCPVLFQQKWDDQLFTRDGQLRLFDALATPYKWLKIYPGAHVAVAGEQADDAVSFLAAHLDPATQARAQARS